MISLIWAMDPNGLIGIDNKLPWSYKEDMAYFKKTTSNHTVVMGQMTFRSIGKPLPNRKNIVATLDPNYKCDGVTVINDLVSFLKEKHDEEIFVIGGMTIYKLALPFADRLYITHIKKEHVGNVYFPSFDLSLFNKVKSIDAGELEFAVYERK